MELRCFGLLSLGLILWLGRSPGGGHDNPLQYSCLENPHGQRGLAGCSPLSLRESDATGLLSPAQHIPCKPFPVLPEDHGLIFPFDSYLSERVSEIFQGKICLIAYNKISTRVNVFFQASHTIPVNKKVGLLISSQFFRM